MSKIKIGEIMGDGSFELDVQKHIISRGLGLLGIRAGGKSYTSGKTCEQLSAIKQPYLVIDLMGEYYTLKERFPVVVISQGSEKYADVKNIRPEMAEAIAHVVLESGQSTVLDLKAGTMLEKFKFLAAFLPALYNAAKELRRPTILVMDEAHRITPERSLIRLRDLKEFQDKVIYWTYEIGNTGRQYGLGFIAIARRSAEVAKSTLNNCELILQFKAKGIDLDDILTKDFTRENRGDARKRIIAFKPGDALVRGLAEPVFIHISPRECSHGGGTPLTKPVEVPGMTKFSSMLKRALAEVQISPEKGISPKVVADLNAKIKGLTTQYERDTKALRGELAQVQREREKNAEDNKGLNERVISLTKEVQRLREVPPERIARLQQRIREVEDQLSEASQLEEQLEMVRGGAKDLIDSMVDFSRVLGLELIPQDISEVIRERDEYKKQLDIYEATERETRIRTEETLRDPAIKNWVQTAKSFLHGLKRSSRGVFPKVLKAALSMDPEVDFWPEEIEAGVTAGTVQGYLNQLVDKKLLWVSQKRGRKAYRNRFSAYVGENIRRIKPLAPDEGVKSIEEDLRGYVLGG